jgi:hypothetical protein
VGAVVHSDWRNNLSDLPEEKDYINEVLEDGTTIRRRLPIKFCVDPVRHDDPFMFSDAEGAWFVIRGLEGGPYKRRAR